MTCTTSIWDEKVEQIYEVNDKVCKSERKNKFLLGFFPFGFVLNNLFTHYRSKLLVVSENGTSNVDILVLTATSGCL